MHGSMMQKTIGIQRYLLEQCRQCVIPVTASRKWLRGWFAMAMSVRRKITWGVAGALAICALAWALIGQRINMIAKGPVNLYDKPMDGQVIKVLNPGEITPVVGCVDLKHYIVLIVLIDSRRAYVHEGDYRLGRKSVWNLNAGPVSLSCP
jgi:hypothetical protein